MQGYLSRLCRPERETGLDGEDPDDTGRADEAAAGRAYAAAIRYHQRRCLLMGARCAGPFISITAALSSSNCGNGNLPP
jgi:hypothetical protein